MASCSVFPENSSSGWIGLFHNHHNYTVIILDVVQKAQRGHKNQVLRSSQDFRLGGVNYMGKESKFLGVGIKKKGKNLVASSVFSKLNLKTALRL